MSSISRVAIVGAAGSLGSVIFKRLVESGDFKVTVLRRLGSKSTYPADVEVADVDFSSLQSLESALRGQDAVVSTIGNMGFMDQWTLVDAAAAAGVKRFIPSGFGSDLDNPKTQQLPVFADKIKVDNHLTEVCKGSKMTWTTVSNSAFLDWGLEKGFILNLHVQNPQILDGGDLPFSTTTLSTVADAVVGIFKHPAETENRTVFVHDLVTTQNQLLALAKKALPTRSWEPTHASIDDLIQKSNTQLREGNIDGGTFLSYLWRSILTPGYGGEFKKTDNELLGIPLKDEAFVVNVIKSVME